jgi:hypothetical protein
MTSKMTSMTTEVKTAKTAEAVGAAAAAQTAVLPCKRCEQRLSPLHRHSLWFAEAMDELHPPPPLPKKPQEDAKEQDYGYESEEDPVVTAARKKQDKVKEQTRPTVEFALSNPDCKACQHSKAIHRMSVLFCTKGVPKHWQLGSVHNGMILEEKNWKNPSNWARGVNYSKESFRTRVSLMYPNPGGEEDAHFPRVTDFVPDLFVSPKKTPRPRSIDQKEILLNLLDLSYRWIRYNIDVTYSMIMQDSHEMICEDNVTAWSMQFRLDGKKFLDEMNLYYVFTEYLVASLYWLFVNKHVTADQQEELWRKYIFLPPMKCIICQYVENFSCGFKSSSVYSFRRCPVCLELCCADRKDCLKQHQAYDHL